MNEDLNTSPPKTNSYELNKEVDTGETWIDGKPIYRKVIQTIFGNKISSSSNQENDLIILSNIDKIVKVYSDMECTVPSYHVQDYYFDKVSNYFCYVQYQYMSNNQVRFFERHNVNEANGKNITIIVEYTKV